MDDAFGNYLAGFTDGEGCFQIFKRWTSGYECTFQIDLRNDDIDILNEFCAKTGIGKVYIRERYAKWLVFSKKDLAVLVEIFDKYPLRAKKARDYAIWRIAVIANIKAYGDKAIKKYAELEKLRWELRNIRAYKEPECLSL